MAKWYLLYIGLGITQLVGLAIWMTVVWLRTAGDAPERVLIRVIDRLYMERFGMSREEVIDYIKSRYYADIFCYILGWPMYIPRLAWAAQQFPVYLKEEIARH